MKNGAMGVGEIPVTGDALQLASGLATGMPMGTDVAAPEPAVIGAIVSRTEVRECVDGAAAAPGEDHNRGRWAGNFRTRSEIVLTGLAERFVDISGEGLRLVEAFAPGWVRLKRRLRCRPETIGPPDVHDEADQHQRNQQELVKPQIRCHDDVPFHGGERKLLYRIDSYSNYPSRRGTGPPTLLHSPYNKVL